ncbi:ester cyclase [Vagococcus sp. BWB3-3]|uniref:Ester cyclase n=1 Tax=Vagococcus allomyrinae TaxID=2794353 RepID=A0A940P6K3_9ENTE|nr:ester cyclase [Vagococcus allomyrinae]MBP1042352.1 ester cyclase [Vagococcus allomyrinae]
MAANQKITKNSVQRFYTNFFNKQEVSHADDLIAENYIQHNPNVPQGRAGLIAAFQEKFSSQEYFQLAIDHILLADDYVAVFLRSVTEQGCTKAHVVDLYRVENNQFVEHWDYFDKRGS